MHDRSERYNIELLGLRPGSPPARTENLRGEKHTCNIWSVYTALLTALEARAPKTLLFPYLFGYDFPSPPPDLPHLFFRKEAKFDTQERLAANSINPMMITINPKELH